MKITDFYGNGKIPASLEIFPPKGELRADDLRSMLTELKDTDPAFISVTCSAGGVGGSSVKTARLAGIIQNEYSVTAVAHVTSINSTFREVDEAVRVIHENGVRNILALRGDRLPGCEPSDFHYGAELIRYLRSKPENDDPTIGAGCYPEGHIECRSLEADIDGLKAKADAGAQFLLSQLFFDNEAFYRFIDRARAKGVSLPVEAGIMPIMSKSQITRMIFLCGASLPAPVVRLLARYENDAAALVSAALEYSAEQITDLVKSGAADGIHIYSMNKPEVARYLVEVTRDAGAGL